MTSFIISTAMADEERWEEEEMVKLKRERCDNKGTKSDLHDRVQSILGPDLSADKYDNLPPT